MLARIQDAHCQHHTLTLQAQSDLGTCSSALTAETQEAAALSTQVEQLGRDFIEALREVTRATISGAAAGQAQAAVQEQLALEKQHHAATQQRLVQLEAGLQQDSLAQQGVHQSQVTLQKQEPNGDKVTSNKTQRQQSSSASALPVQVLSQAFLLFMIHTPGCSDLDRH